MENQTRDVRNQIIQGNSAEVLKEVKAGSIDVAITDPPYLVNYRDSHGRTVANDANAEGVLPTFPELYRVMKPNSLVICFAGWTALDAFTTAWREVGFQIVGHIVWAKDYASSSRQTAFHHESAYVLAKGRPKKPTVPLPDVQEWVYSGNKLHPTEKAVEIIKPLVETFSKPGDLVLDPFLGSGTTAVAASLMGRDYLGIELEERYCQLARKRLKGVERFRSRGSVQSKRAA
ncbi:MAG: DNA methylase [Rhizobiales bacterium]|nr:DNA methylase [Hyphomicrobiales bacterium]MBO6699027.1 DNA methylase [Hyphomicrobiales bacterium]MBO6736565.1 DNA methylase [Hyphomicrobiales bacterium]MBO6912361.1 DNA methylase [Hyphomicrobiales bacterium]MBO6956277.1 DNA methylase [Hyphomicrobiales bacterium]